MHLENKNNKQRSLKDQIYQEDKNGKQNLSSR